MNFFNASPQNYCLNLAAFVPFFPQKYLRDEKGRFTKNITLPTENGNPLPNNIKDPIVGNMLGDGHLRFTHKDKKGKPKLGTNALYAMTLKSQEYIMYLWSKFILKFVQLLYLDLVLVLIQGYLLHSIPLTVEVYLN